LQKSKIEDDAEQAAEGARSERRVAEPCSGGEKEDEPARCDAAF